MSDVMTRGVLLMPFDLAMSSELTRRQFYERAQEVLAERDAAIAELDAARKTALEEALDAAHYAVAPECVQSAIRELLKKGGSDE